MREKTTFFRQCVHAIARDLCPVYNHHNTPHRELAIENIKNRIFPNSVSLSVCVDTTNSLLLISLRPISSPLFGKNNILLFDEQITKTIKYLLIDLTMTVESPQQIDNNRPNLQG